MIKTAISFMLGCGLLLLLPTLPSVLWLWLVIPIFVLFYFPPMRIVATIGLGFLWALFYASSTINDRLSPSLVGQDLLITGKVASIPEQSDRRLSFYFSPDPSELYTLPETIRLNWYRPLPAALGADAKWQLTVRLKQARGMMNPGAFDYESWLFQKGIGAVGYVRSSPNNKQLSPAPFYSVNALRQALVNKVEAQLEHNQNIGLIQGLTTGIRHNISQQQWQTLRLSGTSHLLAISGLHIGLAAGIGFFCFKWLWALRANNLLVIPSKSAGAIGGFILALFYAFMAGFSVPSQRALIMVATLMLSLVIQRPAAISSILAVSLLLILLIDPLALLAPGLWLSFGAVTIILFISQNRFPSPRWQWARIHTLIAIGLTPLLLLFFMQTSVIAPIANFIAVPAISFFVVPVLLLASFFSWVFEPLGTLLFELADFLLSLLWPILVFLADLPFSHWSSPALPAIFWLSVLLGVLLLLAPKHSPAKWLGFIGLIPLIFYKPIKPDENEFWFTLLDVGQGLGAVVQTKNHTLVFDTGPKFSDKFNTGTAIVRPFLQQQGIEQIDTLIVSHGDNDHFGGALPLIEEIAINTIFSSEPDLIPTAKPCLSGQSWQWDGVVFSMLHPTDSDVGSENNLSCVLQISAGNKRILLTGDIESEAERLLIERYENKLRSSVLIAPHHGSKTSSTAAFIDAVRPEIVLFPVGYRNRYGFPKDEIVTRYTARNITPYDTAQSGSIQLKFTPQAISEPHLWRQEAQRIWTATND